MKLFKSREQKEAEKRAKILEEDIIALKQVFIRANRRGPESAGYAIVGSFHHREELDLARYEIIMENIGTEEEPIQTFRVDKRDILRRIGTETESIWNAERTAHNVAYQTAVHEAYNFSRGRIPVIDMVHSDIKAKNLAYLL